MAVRMAMPVSRVVGIVLPVGVVRVPVVAVGMRGVSALPRAFAAGVRLRRLAPGIAFVVHG